MIEIIESGIIDYIENAYPARWNLLTGGISYCEPEEAQFNIFELSDKSLIEEWKVRIL